MLKYLRITVTVLSLTACIVVVVLWRRSYSSEDMLFLSIRHVMQVRVHSVPSRIYVTPNLDPIYWDWKWKAYRYRDDGSGMITLTERVSRRFENVLGFGSIQKGGRREYHMPHWFPAGLFAFAAAIPWLKWRFSLRTLLIATTLVAVVLGIIVAAR